MLTNSNFKKTATVEMAQASEQTMKVDIKYRRYINTALIIGPMTMIMAVVGVTRNFGLHPGWFIKCTLTWLTMFPIAYLCAFFVIPIANKITNKIKFYE